MDLKKDSTSRVKAEEVNEPEGSQKISEDILAKQEEYLRRLNELDDKLTIFCERLMACQTDQESYEGAEKGSEPEDSFEVRMNHFLELERRYLESLETTISHLEQFA
jgi:hypothetical protein